MARTSSIGLLITAAATFTAGYAVGLLMAPRSGRESRELIKKKSKDALHWAEEMSHEVVEESEKKIHEINEKVHKKVKDAIPDLYEATEDILLSEDEVKMR